MTAADPPPLEDHPHDRVVHAIARDDWRATSGDVRPESLASDGFIHFSTPAQIAWVCTERFAGRADLVLLVVDPAALPSPLVWEDCYDAGQAFPHLYGALPRAAITAVVDYPSGADGRFRPPVLP